MLRKNLGDAKVAYFIFNHGMPALLDDPASGSKPRDIAQLTQQVEKFMYWHSSLLASLAERNLHPDLPRVRKQSAPDDFVWREVRRQRLTEACEKNDEGKRLAKERDTVKRKMESMSATE